VAFQSDREGDPAIYQQRQDGIAPAERLTKPEAGLSHMPEAWSPSGDALLYSVRKDQEFTLWILSLRDHKSNPFGGVTLGLTPQSTFSPDGRWVAYRSNQSVYIQPVPATGAMYQIGAGHSPVWASSGKEIYFFSQQALAIASITTRPTVDVGKPSFVRNPFTLIISSLNIRAFDVMPDGRVIAPIAIDADPATRENPRIHIVANWFQELTARVPVK
jgi:Tol biopolymer transport system component